MIFDCYFKMGRLCILKSSTYIWLYFLIPYQLNHLMLMAGFKRSISFFELQFTVGELAPSAAKLGTCLDLKLESYKLKMNKSDDQSECIHTGMQSFVNAPFFPPFKGILRLFRTERYAAIRFPAKRKTTSVSVFFFSKRCPLTIHLQKS